MKKRPFTYTRPIKPPTSGFTLVELLVVLAVIGLLAALLFPAFGRMQERAAQASCSSSLRQIGIAVRQYYLDEKTYPVSLTVLMPVSIDMDGDGNPDTDGDGTPENAKSAAILTSLDLGKCPDDDTDGAMRHSYSLYGVGPALPELTTAPGTPAAPSTPDDGAKYVWNYWGYNIYGYAYQSPTEAAADQGAGPTYPRLVNKSAAYSHPLITPGASRNVVENSLSNRYAPPSTIITHCIYHRTASSGLNAPTELYYAADPTMGQNSRDLILMLDSSVKTLDVSEFNVPGANGVTKWQSQNLQ